MKVELNNIEAKLLRKSLSNSLESYKKMHEIFKDDGEHELNRRNFHRIERAERILKKLER